MFEVDGVTKETAQEALRLSTAACEVQVCRTPRL